MIKRKVMEEKKQLSCQFCTPYASLEFQRPQPLVGLGCGFGTLWIIQFSKVFCCILLWCPFQWLLTRPWNQLPFKVIISRSAPTYKNIVPPVIWNISSSLAVNRILSKAFVTALFSILSKLKFFKQKLFFVLPGLIWVETENKNISSFLFV